MTAYDPNRLIGGLVAAALFAYSGWQTISPEGAFGALGWFALGMAVLSATWAFTTKEARPEGRARE